MDEMAKTRFHVITDDSSLFKCCIFEHIGSKVSPSLAMVMPPCLQMKDSQAEC